MKQTLLNLLIVLATVPATAQISITATDMPVNGDTLRYSIANPATAGINLNDSGTSKIWNFNNLTPIAQAVDTYKSAAQVNASYAFTISPTAYGIKIADSLPGAPIPVKEIYNFFNKKTGPARFVIEGFAAKISGTPIPINYSDEDEVYLLPLTYPHGTDSTTFKLSFSFSGLGSFSQQGYRKTRVDGWGTIVTPFTATPVSVIRVRSEIVEVDSFAVAGSAAQGIPRTSVEYKWLSNTTHYPMLIVTTNKAGGNETVTGVRYRDVKRNTTGVAGIRTPVVALQAFPNPAHDMIRLQIPAGWKSYVLHVYDVTGKLVATTNSASQVSVEHLAAGNYLITAESDGVMGVARFEK